MIPLILRLKTAAASLKMTTTNSDFPPSGDDVLGSSPLRAGGSPTLLLLLGLVLQLHQFMVILDIHQATKGVQHLVEQCQDTQQGSKKVELDYWGHHDCFGTAGCKNREKKKKEKHIEFRKLKSVRRSSLKP